MRPWLVAVLAASSFWVHSGAQSHAVVHPEPPTTGDAHDGGHDHGGGDRSGIDPAELSPDRPIAGPQGTVGQFVVECVLSHTAPDDPIVHPGHRGASHLHDFFGSDVVTADSTYEDLVAGATSCQQRLDTASYWAPALLDPAGTPVPPLRGVAYYRAGIDVDPTTVVAYPPGFKMIAGDAAATAAQPTSVAAWTCNAGASRHEAPPSCPDGANLRLIITFPDCWNGTDTDSDDHVSHVRYSSGGVCPASHPVAIPQLQFAIDYPHIPDPNGYALASGPITGAHSDFWNGWDQDKLEREVATCINDDVVCGISGRGVGG